MSVSSSPSPLYASAADVKAAVAEMKAWFETGATLSLHVRRRALESLHATLKHHEAEILEALTADLGKSRFEGYATELGIVYDELKLCASKLYAWAKPHRVATSIAHFPSTSKVYPTPLGVAAVLSPWNYPLQLALVPLIDAITAGNCVVLKPSHTSPHTSEVLATICQEAFDQNHVRCLPSGGSMNDWVLEARFDKIFFTGSPRVGRTIMKKAAENLTDVTLELGGKSPCIIDKDANIKRAGQRIAWGKSINSGQTCVAPDYVLAHEDIAEEFVEEYRAALVRSYGEDVLANVDFPHMINKHHFERACNLIDSVGPQASVVVGGKRDEKTLKIEPTVIMNASLDDPVMGEEIFGPVLPIITWRTFDDVLRITRSFPHPLACYLFTNNKILEETVIARIPFGGGCINDTVVHLANNKMGFGGVGESGLGSYHGKCGFDCFTHYKSTLKKSTLIELPVRCAPFTPLKEAIVRLLMR